MYEIREEWIERSDWVRCRQHQRLQLAGEKVINGADGDEQPYHWAALKAWISRDSATRQLAQGRGHHSMIDLRGKRRSFDNRQQLRHADPCCECASLAQQVKSLRRRREAVVTAGCVLARIDLRHSLLV